MKIKEQPLISIIVPVYKAEKYVGKCIEALMNQTYQNLEIILIEDGSPDNSGVICDEYAQRDCRIKVIHKPNGGAATARNAGLDVMTGKYVAFVDSDDYMELHYIETLYRTLVENQAQVAICSFKTVDEDGNRVSIDELHDENNDIQSIASTTNKKQVQIFSGNDIILQDLRGHWEHVAPWGKLFDAALYDNIRYPHWFAHEDEPVFIWVFDKVEKVATIDDKLYYYVQHAGSLMNTAYSEKDRSTYLKMWQERITYYSDNIARHQEIRNCILQAYVAWNILYLSLHAHEMTSEQVRELKRELRRYAKCLVKSPHLFSTSYSMKLGIKCIFTLISTKILGKRYVK